MRVQPADRTKQLIFSYSKGKFLFYGVQARRQVFYGEVRSNEETDQMRPEEYVSTGGGGGGSFGCLRLNCAASLELF